MQSVKWMTVWGPQGVTLLPMGRGVAQASKIPYAPNTIAPWIISQHFWKETGVRVKTFICWRGEEFRLCCHLATQQTKQRSRSNMSWFAEIKQAPAIEVFALTQSFNEDSYPQKVNLSVGGGYCQQTWKFRQGQVGDNTSHGYWMVGKVNTAPPWRVNNICSASWWWMLTGVHI